ncbi:MAG: hypothetical protein U9N14_02500, partial [Pseudomonadota bacterium]|nr:hypothetical protein [Pseudomonadota bacterium]
YEKCSAKLDSINPPHDPHGLLVVLLPGLARTVNSLGGIRRALIAAGYRVETIGYPSTRDDVRVHVERIERTLERMDGSGQIVFATHSMGGIVARHLLVRNGAWTKRFSPVGLVMIGTPNNGAHMASLIDEVPIAEFVLGPSLDQLTTEQSGAVPVPTGLRMCAIAGGLDNETGCNPLIPGDDDGIVGVDEVFADFVPDRLLVPQIHSFLMNHPDTIAAVLRFLKGGRCDDDA